MVGPEGFEPPTKRLCVVPNHYFAQCLQGFYHARLEGSYWLDLFSGTTWREFRAAGARITGFRPRMRNSVARVRKGDILLCYLTGAMRWVGALEVLGNSNDRRPIWSEPDFPARLEVKPLIVPEPEHGVPMSEFAEKAPFYRNVACFKKFKGFLRACPKRFKNRRNGEIILRMLYAAQRPPTIPSRPPAGSCGECCG